MKWHPVPAVLAVMVLATAGCDRGPQRVSPDANLIVIGLDTVRADHLGAYGNDWIETPALDAFAREAFVFERAYATAPWTLPAFASVFTGLHPGQHGAVGGARMRVRDDTPTLAETLRERGYATRAFVAVDWLTAETGLDRGFDRLHATLEGPPSLRSRAYQAAALDYLRAPPDEPFFLFLHYYDAHAPYDPPPPFGGMYYEGDPSSKGYGSMAPVYADSNRTMGWPEQLYSWLEGVEDIEYPIKQYAAGVSHVDSTVGEVLEVLSEAGLLESSIVVVVADHGEHLVEHATYFTHRFPYEETLRIPLMLRLPSGEAGRFAPPVSGVDLRPTILARLGIEDGAGGPGLDLLAAGLAEGRRGGMLRRPILAHYGEKGGVTTVLAGPYRLLRFSADGEPPRYELYDHRSDPTEARDLAAEKPEVVARLAPQLEVPAMGVRGLEAGGGESELSGAAVERLRALGYFGDSADAEPESREIRLVDVSQRTGLRDLPPFPDGARHDYGPLWADLDGDGRLDLVFMNHGETPGFYLNRGGGILEDRFDTSGWRSSEWAYFQRGDRRGAACADFDNDGDVDFVIAKEAARSETLEIKYAELLVNRGDATFDEIHPGGSKLNQGGRGRTPSWADWDRDGRVDLFVGNFASASRFYRNLPARAWEEVSARAGLRVPTAYLGAWNDHDDDGLADILLAGPPRLFRGVEGGFVEQADALDLDGLEARQGGAVAWGDLQGDGYADLILSSGVGGGVYEYHNGGDGFTRRRLPVAGGAAGAGVVLGDLDLDGDLDLVSAGREGLAVVENSGEAGFVARDLAVRWSPGIAGDVALGDYDGDGDLDLAVTSDVGERLLENRAAPGAWMQVSLAGSRSNRMGFGARLEFTVPELGAPESRAPDSRDRGITVRRWRFGDSGVYHSVGCGPVHVGLGAATRVGLGVRWPSGQRQRFASLPVAKSVTIVETAE